MNDKTMHIDVHPVTRVEGHGRIIVDTEGKTIKKVEWNIPEAPRFFESMVVGRHFTEVATITSRICGICSISHTFSSLKATESALGMRISEQTDLLRRTLLWGEQLQSHILHIGYLAAPDLLRVNSVIPLVSTHKDVVLLVIKLHRLANETCDIIGGRTTHPIRTTVGGWTMLPEPKELEALKKQWQEAMSDMKKLAEVVGSLAGEFPKFVRETEYICLHEKTAYAHYDGMIKSSDVAQPIPVADYRRVTNEYVIPQSTAKWTKFNRQSYFVGALARFNNNFSQLSPAAQKTASQLGLAAPNYNPYMNTVAQVVESVNALENGVSCMERLLDNGIKEEKKPDPVLGGRGANAVEAPRGILFHDYTYDKKGMCVKANCIIPTNQNHANIQKDMEQLVPQYIDQGKDELQRALEMLVRAYDPCISCSTHCLDITFL